MSDRSALPFQPYATATRETPMLHMILEPCCLSFLRPLLAIVYKLRWTLSYPLRTRLFPTCIPSVPFLDYLLNLTVGEVILAVPLLFFFLECYHNTFISPSVADSGSYASYAIVAVYVTANKSNSFLSFLFGIPFERMIWLHNLSSLVAVVLGGLHTYTAFEYDGSEYAKFQGNDIIKFLFDWKTNLSGTIALGCMFLLVLLSFFRIVRYYMFQIWLSLHIILAVGVVVGLILHGVSEAYFIAVWWGLDLLVRYGIQAVCRYRTRARFRRIADGERDTHEPAVEISFPKPAGFDYNAGQFVQIAVPKLSLEFHPVTISSAPHEDNVTLHVRRLGDWTAKLLALTDCNEQILLEGPYGASSVDLDDDERYPVALFVSGGIGVTPCQSIGKHLIHQHRAHGRKLEYMEFVWAVRHISMVQDIPPLTTKTEDCKDGKVRVDIYCTRQDEEDDDAFSNPNFNLHYGPNYNLHYGRPDLESTFERMKSIALKRKVYSIAVFGCGPKPLMNDLATACRKHSESVVGCGGGVFFDLHTEHFDF